MPLSDYERRVLAEIEDGLGQDRSLLRARLRVVGLLALAVLVLGALTTTCALWLTAAATAGLCSAACLTAGLALGIGYERRRQL